jgi:hypothetical protein
MQNRIENCDLLNSKNPANRVARVQLGHRFCIVNRLTETDNRIVFAKALGRNRSVLTN